MAGFYTALIGTPPTIHWPGLSPPCTNYNNREAVDVTIAGITVEHIFPQKPEVGWEDTIGSNEFALLGDKYLNTIGNLTLSGNNGQLGNKTFLNKRDMNENGGEQGYRFSRLWLNRDLQTLDRWGVEQVERRAERIAKRFLQVWPAPPRRRPTGGSKQR